MILFAFLPLYMVDKIEKSSRNTLGVGLDVDSPGWCGIDGMVYDTGSGHSVNAFAYGMNCYFSLNPGRSDGFLL